ncbi:non-specific lipid-transfer protein [Apium graveolens]|uniref:Non-specific lipid-transfer protein n=1 Tax=Apium graveolens TaxID=4045 RepID=NLTP1_APIGR|nr:RecName: Full=Non-specific lipid-transfer protein; AltName: Full=Allergen Api g 2.0101; AltName: Allergen=Api g 2; Flags: Precursor [Apium graveolens]ACV04796.1 stalk non-specific lipid-transfer protein 1 [Apium graveolens]
MGVSKVAIAVAVMLMVVVINHPAVVEGLTCGQVTGKLGGCLGYLKGGGYPSPACCGGVKGLNSLAKTPADRKQACACLKTLAGSVKGINYGAASALPGKCGIRIPYPISPSTDCSRVN